MLARMADVEPLPFVPATMPVGYSLSAYFASEFGEIGKAFGVIHQRGSAVSYCQRFLAKYQRPPPACALRLGSEVRLAAFQVDRDRNVLLSDQPLAVNLSVAIGDAHGETELRAVFGRDDGRLDAVRVGQFAVRHDAEVLDFKLIDSARKGREKVLPVLLVVIEADVLARRCHIENKQLGAPRITFHDGIYVLGAKSRREAVFERPDFLLVLVCTRRTRRRAEGDDRQACDNPQCPIFHNPPLKQFVMGTPPLNRFSRCGKSQAGTSTASRIFRSTSSRVRPVETQPSRS